MDRSFIVENLKNFIIPSMLKIFVILFACAYFCLFSINMFKVFDVIRPVSNQ